MLVPKLAVHRLQMTCNILIVICKGQGCESSPDGPACFHAWSECQLHLCLAKRHSRSGLNAAALQG